MSPLAPQLGRPLAELGSGYPAVTALRPLAEWLTLHSPCFAQSRELGMANAGTVFSGGTNQASKPMAFPFVLDSPVTVYHLGWQNGNTLAAANVDVGIYDSVAGVPTNRLVSTGSTAQSGASVPQFVDVTDTVIGPGSYFLVFNIDDGAISRMSRYNTQVVTVNALCGVQDSGTSQFPLPNPLASMRVNAAAQFVPILFIALRATLP